MTRLAWTPVWLVTFLYAFVVALLAARPVQDGLRSLAAAAAALLFYLVVMLGVVTVVQPDGSHAALIYAVSMALSTMTATSIAGLLLPAHFRDRGMLACVTLGLAYPLYLAHISDATAPVQVMLSLYLAGTAIGGLVAVARAGGFGQLTARALLLDDNRLAS